MSRAGDLCGQRVLRHRAVAHNVHVGDPSWFARKQGGVLVLRRGHDGIPICHLRAFIQHMCCQSSTHGGLGSCVMRQNRWWQPCDTTKQQFRHLQRPRWCTEWHINRCSPSRVHRNRAVERHLCVPVLQTHVSSAN